MLFKHIASFSARVNPELQKSKQSGKHARVGSIIGNMKEGALVGARVGESVGASVAGHCIPSSVTLNPTASKHLHSIPRASSHSQNGSRINT